MYDVEMIKIDAELQKESCVPMLPGAIPGAEAPRECGNWLNHDLEECRIYAEDMKEVLRDWTVEQMVYPE